MNNCTHSENGERHPSFQDWFRANLKDGGVASVFVDDGKYVFSMTFSGRHLQGDERGDEIYELDSVGWQEEGLNYGYHNVCHTGWRRGDELNHPGVMIYDLANDEILVDPFLGDKYDDGSEGWASYKLQDLFERVPTAPEHEGYDR